MEMSEETIAKSLFVRGELYAVLDAATDGCVRDLRYRKSGAIETVEIDWTPAPARPVEVHRVDVTADSLWAILKDVMREVERLYG